MSKINITGEVVYQDLGTGFWGIVGDDGQEWRPEKMPGSIQKEGMKVKINAEKAEAGFSIFMWGQAIKILSHEKI